MRKRRTRHEAMLDKRESVASAEVKGIVADSLEVRKVLIGKIHKGEISLEEAQAQLREIKSGAKKKGLITRKQAWSMG